MGGCCAAATTPQARSTPRRAHRVYACSSRKPPPRHFEKCPSRYTTRVKPCLRRLRPAISARGPCPQVHDQFVVFRGGNRGEPFRHLPERHMCGARDVTVRELTSGADVENGRRCTLAIRASNASGVMMTHAVRAPGGTSPPRRRQRAPRPSPRVDKRGSARARALRPRRKKQRPHRRCEHRHDLRGALNATEVKASAARPQKLKNTTITNPPPTPIVTA